MRGPQKKCGVPSPSAEPGSGGPSGRCPSGATALEIMLMTSMRKPSTPRSSHHRIIAYTACRTSGFSQLRSGCLRANRCR